MTGPVGTGPLVAGQVGTGSVVVGQVGTGSGGTGPVVSGRVVSGSVGGRLVALLAVFVIVAVSLSAVPAGAAGLAEPGGDGAGGTAPADGSGDTPAAAPAGDPSTGEGGELQILAARDSGDEVVVDVALPATPGQPGPSAADFAASDGDHLVRIGVTRLDLAAVILAIDTSGSMAEASLAAALDAARTLVDGLPPGTEVGLITFGEQVVVRQEPTPDLGAVRAAIDGIDSVSGQTALWDALVSAAGMITDPGGGAASVVVISDGGNTAGSATQAEAAEALRSRSAQLHAVAIESAEADWSALEEVIDQVGGRFVVAAHLDDLARFSTNLAGRLANRYRLRFVPAASGERTVAVTVLVGGRLLLDSVVLTGDAAGPAADGPAGPALDASGPAGGERIVVIPPLPVSGIVLLGGGALALFTAFVLVGAVVASPSKQVRLATVTATASGADRIAGVKDRLGEAADELVSRHDQERRLEGRLDAADVAVRPGELVVTWAVGATVAALVGLIVAGWLGFGAAVALSLVAVHLFLSIRARRRRSAFADQLTGTLGILISSLRAGQSLPRAIELVSTESPSPTAAEFKRIHFETRVGRDLTESLLDVARRMDSEDVEWMAHAIDIHRELGGDLTEILSNLAATIRERRTVARRIDALSAEGRATGWVLLAMPILMFLFSWWRTPAAIDTMLGSPAGRVMLGVAVVGMVVGHLWIRQLVKFKY